jgi:adenylate cyclase, class 2
MAQETEIKLKINSTKTLLRTLKKLRARPVRGGSGRSHELNVIFDTEQGTLAKHGQLLRIRTETPEPPAKKGKRLSPAQLPKQRVLLTFKKPPPDAATSGYPSGRPNHKVREEIELEVSDGGTLTKVFEGLGMNGWFRYEKYRTTFQLPSSAAWAKGLLIELDETPVGTFVELEGPPGAIDRAAEELGYSRRDYILKNYLVLYTEACRREGKQPGDMLFDTAK